MNPYTLIEQIPKAELHLHIEGTLEPEMMMHLSEKNKIPLSFNTIEDIKAAYEFENLQDFLNLYYQGANVLIDEQDFYDLTFAYLTKAHQDGVTHVEIFFDPQTHTQRNIAFETVIRGIHKALEDAQSKWQLSSKLIMCFLRDLSEQDAFDTLEQAAPFKSWITAVGLDSAEVGHPPSKFERVFEQARTQGYLSVAHAGEEGPSDYIWQALNVLKVSRIDHGIRVTDDPKLIDHLKQSQISLTVCPMSNIKLRTFDTMAEHNIKTLLEHGLCVTVNSDDPSYFGGYVNDNFKAIVDALGINSAQIIQLAKNSFEASFISNKEKQLAFEKIDAISKNLQAAS